MSDTGKSKFDPGARALDWWKVLHVQTDARGNVTSRGNPGALARLRRSASPIAALTEEPAIRLAQRLGASLGNKQRLARIGALAGVLAHVKSDVSSQHMARLLGPSGSDGSAIMSSLRFQRLMAARDTIDLMREMRNAVKLLKGTANIKDLGDAIYYWSDTTRISWTYHYWGVGAAEPDAKDAPDNTDPASSAI